MRQNLKQIITLIAISSLIILSGCTQEKEFINEHNHPNIDFKEKSFKEALSLPLFNDAFQKVAKKRGAFRSEDAARTALEDEYGFSIVVDSPIRIITDENGTVFYTILIEREVKEEKVFENLMIKVEENEASAAIFKYTMSEKGTMTPTGDYVFTDIISSVFTDLNVEGKMFFNSDGETCFDINVLLCDDALGYTHSAYDDCIRNGTAYYATSVSCVGGSGIGIGGTGGTGGSIGGGTTGGSSNNTGGLGASGGTPDPVIVSPIPCRTGNCMELDNLIPTPCETLKDLFSPTKGNILNKMASVNTSAFGPNHVPISAERGAYFTKSGTTYGQHTITPPPGIGSSNNYLINIPIGPTIYAAVHTHPIEGNPPAAPMFSYSDLETLVNLYRATSEENKPHVVFMLILPDGNTYAIKVDDIMKLTVFLTQYNNIMSVQRASDKKMEKNRIFDNKTKNGWAEGQNLDEKERRYTRGFLDEMKDHGVSLYRKTTTSTIGTSNYQYGWEKLEAPVNPTAALIQETPCN